MNIFSQPDVTQIIQNYQQKGQNDSLHGNMCISPSGVERAWDRKMYYWIDFEKIYKNKNPKWEINIEKEIETMRGELPILCEKGRHKDLKTKKARKVIRNYKITTVIDIPSIKEKLKQKNTSKNTEGKTI